MRIRINIQTFHFKTNNFNSCLTFVFMKPQENFFEIILKDIEAYWGFAFSLAWLY